MSENPHTNMDARDLWDLSARVQEEMSRLASIGGGASGTIVVTSEDAAMLLRAAQHLQSMDEKLARGIEGTFAQGATFAERAARARSNVLPPPGRKITNEDGETLIAAFVQTGKSVKKFRPGETMPPKPQKIEVDPHKSAPARTGFRLGDL